MRAVFAAVAMKNGETIKLEQEDVGKEKVILMRKYLFSPRKKCEKIGANMNEAKEMDRNPF